jgi:hypothetical protein
MYFIHGINQNTVVSRNPFWGIPERVIDINDRFISVMNDNVLYCSNFVLQRMLPLWSSTQLENLPLLRRY